VVSIVGVGRKEWCQLLVKVHKFVSALSMD
jgi:hypothetical protein